MKKIIVGFFLLVACGSCGPSSRIISSWKPKDVTSTQYRKIMVLGLINSPDRTLREKMEEHIAGDLRGLGYDALCSCDEFDPKAFENMDEKQAMGKLTNSGIDAVLTVVLLDKTKERYYMPTRIYYTPYFSYHNSFWGYYHTMYDRVYAPGYYEVSTKYFWETNLYSLDQKRLSYSAQSQSFDPPSAQVLGHEYGQMITKDMVKQNVLVNQTKEKTVQN